MGKAHQLREAGIIKRFVYAGNSKFTLVSKKTGIRFTFRIRKKADQDFWFVSLLNGPDNENNFAYIGYIHSLRDGGRILRHGGAKSRAGFESPSWKAFQWFWNVLDGERGDLLERLEFWHEGKCGRCSRPLTVPSSILSGFGPECQKYL